MGTRAFALVWGVVFLGLAATGFIPGLLHPPMAGHPPITVDLMFGLAIGVFPVNILHSLVHLLFGLWGLAAASSWGAARSYAKAVAIVYTVFVVMGLLPVLKTTFGLVPMYGNDVWLHVLLAVPAYYFGWFHTDRIPERG